MRESMSQRLGRLVILSREGLLYNAISGSSIPWIELKKMSIKECYQWLYSNKFMDKEGNII